MSTAAPSTAAGRPPAGPTLTPPGPHPLRPALAPAALRAAAEAAWAATGLPTRRTEDWKYTGVGDLAATSWAWPTALDESPAADAERAALATLLDARRVAGMPRLVWLDGVFAPGLSDALPPRAGRTAGALADRGDGADLPADFGQVAAHLQGHAFAALNTAHAVDGAAIQVARGVEGGAVHVLSVYSGRETPSLALPRLLITVGAGASLEVIEEHVSLGDGPTLVASVAEARVGANGALRHTRVGQEGAGTRHYARLEVLLERDARYAHRGVMLGGAQARCELRLTFAEPGAEAEVDALFAAQAGRHLDLHTVVRHTAPHCTSRQLCKGVAAPGGRGVFTGLVQVGVGAHHTRADQSNPNLLLGTGRAPEVEAGRIDTRPQLEIDNDDVKCSHGATVGQLDADALFYLRARGLPAATAERLLTAAFAQEVLDRVPQADLRARLRAAALAALFGGSDDRLAADLSALDDDLEAPAPEVEAT